MLIALLRWWAASFISSATEEHLLRAHACEPNAPLPVGRLGQLYYLRALRAPEPQRAALLALAIKALKRWYQLQPAIADDFSYLPALAHTCYLVGDLDLATTYASLLVRYSQAHPTWGNACQSGHTYLGLVALKHGDPEGAIRHLLASAMGPSSPQLSSFGPRTELAAELLDAGERDAVLEFFDASERFWGNGRWQLGRWQFRRWRSRIAKGQNPFSRSRL